MSPPTLSHPSLHLSPPTPPAPGSPIEASGQDAGMVGMTGETLEKWTRFAARGGLGVGVALEDNMATHPSELMFLANDSIVLLKKLDSEGVEYLGSCEGIIGRLKSSSISLPASLSQPTHPSPIPTAPITAPLVQSPAPPPKSAKRNALSLALSSSNTPSNTPAVTSVMVGTGTGSGEKENTPTRMTFPAPVVGKERKEDGGEEVGPAAPLGLGLGLGLGMLHDDSDDEDGGGGRWKRDSLSSESSTSHSRTTSPNRQDWSLGPSSSTTSSPPRPGEMERSASDASIATVADFFVTAPSPPRTTNVLDSMPSIPVFPSVSAAQEESTLPVPAYGERESMDLRERRASNPFELDGSEVGSGSGRGSGGASPTLGEEPSPTRLDENEVDTKAGGRGEGEVGKGERESVVSTGTRSSGGGEWAGLGWMMGVESPPLEIGEKGEGEGMEVLQEMKEKEGVVPLVSPGEESIGSRGSGIWEMVDSASVGSMVGVAAEERGQEVVVDKEEVGEEEEAGNRKSRRRSQWFEEMMLTPPTRRASTPTLKDRSATPIAEVEEEEEGEEWDIYNDYARESMRFSSPKPDFSKRRSIKPMTSSSTIVPAMEAVPVPRLQVEEGGMSRSESMETVEMSDDGKAERESSRASLANQPGSAANKIRLLIEAKKIAEGRAVPRGVEEREEEEEEVKQIISGSTSASSCVSSSNGTEQDGSLETPNATPGKGAAEFPFPPPGVRGNMSASASPEGRFDGRLGGKTGGQMSPERGMSTPRLSPNQSPSKGRPSPEGSPRLNSVAATRIATTRQGSTVHGELLGDLTSAKNPVLINFMIGNVQSTRDRAAQEYQRQTPPIPQGRFSPKPPSDSGFTVPHVSHMEGIPQLRQLRPGAIAKHRPRSRSFGSLNIMEIPKPMLQRMGSSASLVKPQEGTMSGRSSPLAGPESRPITPMLAQGPEGSSAPARVQTFESPRLPVVQEDMQQPALGRNSPPVDTPRPMAPPPTLRIDTRTGSTPQPHKEKPAPIQVPPAPKLYASGPQHPRSPTVEPPSPLVSSPGPMTPRDMGPLSPTIPQSPMTRQPPSGSRSMGPPPPMVFQPPRPTPPQSPSSVALSASPTTSTTPSLRSRSKSFSLLKRGPSTPTSPLPPPSPSSISMSPVSSKDFNKTEKVDGANFSLAGKEDLDYFGKGKGEDVNGVMDEWGFLAPSPVPSIFCAGEKERKNVPKLEQSILAITSKPYTPTSSKKLIKLLTTSPLPSSIRSSTWAWLLNSPARSTSPLSYHQLAALASSRPPPPFTGREVSAHFRSHHVFASGSGPRAIQELLAVYGVRHQKAPKWGWDPTWIAGVLLMCSFDREEAYWSFEGVVDRMRAYLGGMGGGEEQGLRVEAGVVMEVLEEGGEGGVAGRIKNMGMAPRSFIPTWLSTLFIPILPYPTVLRLFTLLISTSPSPLLPRLCCAVLSVSSKRLMTMKNRQEMGVYLNSPPQDELLGWDSLNKALGKWEKVGEAGLGKIRGKMGVAGPKRQGSGGQ